MGKFKSLETAMIEEIHVKLDALRLETWNSLVSYLESDLKTLESKGVLIQSVNQGKFFDQITDALNSKRCSKLIGILETVNNELEKIA